MNKYEYVTATILEEKERLEKIIAYLINEKREEELINYQERYNDIVKYLIAKDRYLSVTDVINCYHEKLEKLISIKDEYSIDNILLEDTLLLKFHEDTNNEYRNLLYENIRYENGEVKNILYLLFEKETEYSELVIKRNRLKMRLDKNKYPKTYDTLISQNALIEKQDSILDEIFIIENNIKIEEGKLTAVEDSAMTDGILKILYEFLIIDSYDINKINRKKLFSDNKSLTNIKNVI